MNKYSSKAIKTAATVGMSLAMVLSNVAPVVSNLTSVAAADASDKQTTTAAQKVVAKVLENLEIDYKEAANGENVAPASGSDIEIVSGVKLVGIKTTTTLKDLMEGTTITLDKAYEGFAVNETFIDIATYFATNSSYLADEDINEDALAFAKFVKGYADATTDLATYFTDGAFSADKGVKVVEAVAKGADINSKNKDDVEKAYKALKDNEKYLNAFVYGKGSDTKTDALELVNDFMTEAKDYRSENEDAYNKEYVKALEDTKLDGNITVYEAIEKNADITYKNLSKVEATLKNIKNDKVAPLSKIADYDDVKDAEEVATYIEGIESIISDMKEVKTLLKSTNDDVKTYKKDLATKVEELVKAIGKLDKKDDKTETDLDSALNAFREADAKALKSFVEDYIGQFYTLTPKKLNSGKYVVRLENADYGRYVSTTDVFNLLEKDSDTAGLQYLLTTVIDNTMSEDTYYDTLINEVSTVEELLKAVTTDIEGLTLSSTLTDKQASKIIAAKKAINQLVTSGKIAPEYTSALTSKEKKAVLANAELIETLYFKLIMNGTVTESGWVDKGNGDWDYIAEDGSRPTKWVASGANWYYVKNGTMLRNSWIASDAQGTRWYYVDGNGVMVSNTTVNGYTFNSYGVWVK